MPIALHVYADLRLVLLHVTDPLDDTELIRSLSELRGQVMEQRGFDQLVDARHLQDLGALSGQGVRSAGNLDAVLHTGAVRRLVIVVKNKVGYGLARMYLSAAEADERRVAVMETIKDALDWLGYDADAQRTLLARLGELAR